MRDISTKKRIAVYILLIIFFAVFQSMPKMHLVLWNITPVFLISLTVCIGMFEREIIGGYLGLFAGICWDITSDKIIGFYAVFLLIVGVISGLLITNFMRNNLMTVMMLSGGAHLLYGVADYIGIDFTQGTQTAWYGFIHMTMPQVLYSFIFTIPVYLFCRFLLKKLRQKE